MTMNLKLDALLAGFISIFFVFIANMAIIITALSLLSGTISADLLQLILKIITVMSLALPPYVAARTAITHPLRHSLIIGLIQSIIIIALMTQTASWEGTQQHIIGQMPLVGGLLLLLSLLAGLLARWRKQREK